MTAPNLEQLLDDHRIEMAPGGYWNCHCGVNVDEKGSHAAHVVAAIRDSGYTVIALPEADGSDDRTDGDYWLDQFVRLAHALNLIPADGVWHSDDVIDAAAAQHAGDTQ